ncbi:hypothetical protein HMI56_000907 [Coelomomyces lativittatus]|nr:hypothetical protein HMI56_000907 [Coelomomyces lativittatus]
MSNSHSTLANAANFVNSSNAVLHQRAAAMAAAAAAAASGNVDKNSTTHFIPPANFHPSLLVPNPRSQTNVTGMATGLSSTSQASPLPSHPSTLSSSSTTTTSSTNPSSLPHSSSTSTPSSSSLNNSSPTNNYMSTHSTSTSSDPFSPTVSTQRQPATSPSSICFRTFQFI